MHDRRLGQGRRRQRKPRGCVTILLDQEGKWRLEGEAEKERESASANASLADDNGTAVDNVLRGEMVPTLVVSSLAEVAPDARSDTSSSPRETKPGGGEV